MSEISDYRVNLPEEMTMEKAADLLKQYGITIRFPDSRPATWRHIERVGQYLDTFMVELMRRRRVHDQTKLVPPEVEPFDKATPHLGKFKFGTPEYEENRKMLGPALDHHYACNSHHPQHFPKGVSGMSLWDVVEMFCDCKAASERNADGGNMRYSIDILQRDFKISDELKQIFINTFDLFTRTDPPMGK